jgi:predicted DNA repair protein MutK
LRAGIILPPSPRKEPAKMNLSKPVNPIRNYAVGSVITALILLSPVVAFLMVIAAEMLIDLLMVGGTSAVCVAAAGSIGLVMSRKFWRRSEVVHQAEPELVPGETSIAAAPT